jgi:hypothetical protein
MIKKQEEPFGRPPAGGRVAAAAATSRSAAGQQAGGAESVDAALGVIVANERDRRTLAWLRDQVGDEAIRGAVDQLAGNRRPYLSNVAKVLGVALPRDLEVVDRETARARLAALRAQLGI